MFFRVFFYPSAHISQKVGPTIFFEFSKNHVFQKKKVSGRVSSGDDKSDKKKPSMLELGEIMYAEHFCARVNAKKFKGKTAKDITDKG